MDRRRVRAVLPVVLTTGWLTVLLGASVPAHGGVIPPVPNRFNANSGPGPLPPGPSTPAPAPTAAPPPFVPSTSNGSAGTTNPSTGVGLAGRALGPSTGG